MNSARLARSKRLQAVFAFWSDSLWHSTLETIHATGRTAINSIASELRDNHVQVDCERRGDVWYYRIPSP